VNRDIVSLGMVKDVACRQGGTVSFTIRLREAGSPLQIPWSAWPGGGAGSPGVKAVEINFESSPKSQLRDTTG